MEVLLAEVSHENLVGLIVLGACFLFLLTLCYGSELLELLKIWLARRNQEPRAPVSPAAEQTVRICQSCKAPLVADAPAGLCPVCLLKVGMGSEPGSPSSSGSGISGLAATVPAADYQHADAGPQPLTPAGIARHFPQFEILELLGQGGMGMVYKARQPKLDRFVALKILSPELSRDPAFAERFNREARALARLNHPNIITVFDFGQTDAFVRPAEQGAGMGPVSGGASAGGPLYYFVMEYMDGMNLGQLEQSRRLTPEEALAIVPKVCDALQYAHDEGVVHRDIKPGNILVDKKGRVKIADFGLAKLVGKEAKDFTLTAAGMVMGTPRYMAPEQLERPTEVDHRADIYSLGVVFYEMLTGELPMGRFSPPSQKVQVDIRLDEVVLRSLERDVQRRYQSAGEVKTDVEGITGRKPHSTVRAPEHTPVETVGSTPAAEVAPGVDESILLQLSLPATAVGTAGGVGLGGVIGVVIPMLLGIGGGMNPGIVILLAGLCLVGLPMSCFVIWAGLNMRRCQRYEVASHGSLVATLPFYPGWLIGMPAGIWAIRVLNRPDVKAAFHLRAAQAPPISLRRDYIGLAGISIVTAILLGFTIDWAKSRDRAGANFGLHGVPVTQAPKIPAAQQAPLPELPAMRNESTATRISPTGAASAQQPIVYTFGGPAHFAPGSDGPQFLKSFADDLELTELQTAEVNKIIPRYYREFVALERQHTTVTKDSNGHVHITIAPFAADTITLARRMNAEIRGTIGKELLFPDLYGNLVNFGLFRHCGEAEVKTELWKEGGLYQFNERHGVKKIPGGTGGGQNRSVSGRNWKMTFPEEYWVYWTEN